MGRGKKRPQSGHSDPEKTQVPLSSGDGRSKLLTTRPQPVFRASWSSADMAYRSIWNFPSLYFHYNQVLNQCFYHYGRGDQWENGEIVNYQGSGYDDGDGDPRGLVPYDYLHRSDILDSESSESMRQMAADGAAQRREQARWARDHIEVLSKMRLPLRPTHQASKHVSPICSIPDDITYDWAQAAHEAAELALVADLALAINQEHKAEQFYNRQCATQARKRLVELGFPVPKFKAEPWTPERVLPLVQKVFAEGHEEEGCCLAPALVAGDVSDGGIGACRERAGLFEHSFCRTVVGILATLTVEQRQRLYSDPNKSAYGPFPEPYEHQLSYYKRHSLSPEAQKGFRELLENKMSLLLAQMP